MTALPPASQPSSGPVQPPPLSPVSYDIFARLFRGLTRVWLDWAMLDTLAPRASIGIWSPADAARSWFTPWYLGPHGETSFDVPHAAPLPLGAVAGSFDRLYSDRRLRIRELASAFRASPVPPVLVVGLYHATGGAPIVIDGAHRTAAAILSGTDARLVGVALHGPDDAAVLPDLVHHRDPQPRREH